MSSDGLTLTVFDPTNTTELGTLSQVLSAEFSDEFNAPGMGQVVVPLSSSADRTLLVKDNVIRVSYQGSVRFAWFIEILERDLALGSGQQTITASGRGLLAWLEDAVVYPQGGLSDFTSDQRPFNYASADGGWKTSVTWSAPQGVVWTSDDTARKNLPVKWRAIDPEARWIWATNPTTAVQRGTINYFRATFTLSESTLVAFFASFDNFGQVWVNGTLIMDSSRFNETAPSYAQHVRVTVRLGKGTHTVAARVRNDKPWERSDLTIAKDDNRVDATAHGLVQGTRVRVTDVSKSGTGLTKGDAYYLVNVQDDSFKLSTTSGGSPVDILEDAKIDLQIVADSLAGFLFSCWSLDNDNKPNSLILRSNTTQWEVATEQPQHRPAMILRTLMAEATARGVYRFSKFDYNFDQAAPSSGSWTTQVDMTLKVGTTLLQVLDVMVDLGIDFWITPTTCRLSAWETRGVDRTSTVSLELERELMQYSTRAEPKLKTQALIRTKEGWAQTARNADTNGRREVYLEYANTRDEQTARVAATRFLRRSSQTQVTTNRIEAAVITGSVPYVNFTVGDFVTVPNAGGLGTTAARVLAIGMQHDGKNVRFMPELEIL